MQNPTQRFRQSSSIVFKKPGVLSDKLKSLTSSNYHRVNIFDGILHSFHTYQCLQNRVWDFFLFCLDLDLFARIKKDMVSFCTLTEIRFVNNSRSKQNKKNPEHRFIDIVK